MRAARWRVTSEQEVRIAQGPIQPDDRAVSGVTKRADLLATLPSGLQRVVDVAITSSPLYASATEDTC